MPHPINCLSLPSCSAVLGLWALGSVGLAVAQNADPVEPQGHGWHAKEVRARELRSALKTQPPAADGVAASRKLSAQERQAMRAQLREQRRDTPRSPAHQNPDKP